jgi:DnaJ-domain-containing protein 1
VTALRGALLAALRRAALAISVAGGLAHPAAAAPAADVLDLSGSWRFALDREDRASPGAGTSACWTARSSCPAS